MFHRHRPAEELPDVTPARQDTPGIMAAREAQSRARQGFLDAVDSGVESRQVADRMNTLLARNHFGPLVSEVFRRP